MKAHINIPKLSEEQRQSCEERITTEECRTIKETFQNNKSSGNDGLPVEFYKSCWDLISEPFIDCVNESFDKEKCLVPKAGCNHINRKER